MSFEVPKLQDLLERKARQLAKREAELIRLSIPDMSGTLHYTDGDKKNAIPWWKVRQDIAAAMSEALYEKHLQDVTDDFMRAVDAVKDLQDSVAQLEEAAA